MVVVCSVTLISYYHCKVQAIKSAIINEGDLTIGGSHVSDRLPRPRVSKHDVAVRGGEVIMIRNYEEHE